MKDLFALLEKVHALRSYAFSRRFFPVVVVTFPIVFATTIGLGDMALNPGFKTVALTFAIGMLGMLWVNATLVLPHEKRWLQQAEKLIEDCDFEEARHVLAAPPPLIGFAAGIQRQAKLVCLRQESRDLTAAYSSLLAAEQEVLLPEERLSLQLTRAGLMFAAGNYTAFGKTLGELASGVPKSGFQRFRYALLKSREHELRGQFSEAKTLLEEASQITPELKLGAVAFNNLARLEDIQGNDTNAQSYYEQAWQVLRAYPMPMLYPVVGHNLLIKYGRNGAVEKAMELLSEYRGMVAPGNVHQYIEFLNDQVHLARELGNTSMLLDSYKDANRVFVQEVKKSRRLALAVSELRMRFNDGVPVADQLALAASLLDENKDLPTEDRFQALRELLWVLQQCNASAEGRSFRDMQARAMADLLAMEGEIDAQLRDTPPVLPIIRDVWYGHKLEICKLKIGLSAPRLSHSDFDKMFDLLHQRQRVWADKGNSVGELTALIAVCGEFVVYAEQLDPRFTSDYAAKAQRALAEAVQVLERQWPHPSVYQHAMAVAYFSWRLRGDKALAAQWLSRFEKTKPNLAHYAKWFRDSYVGVRGWLGGLD